MYDDVIKLVGVNKSADDYGDLEESEKVREVYAELKNINQTEFYQAQAVGIKAELKFVLADYMDYRRETRLRYAFPEEEEEDYTILRTFRKGNELEITCKKGVD